jgi:hypothetical protein
LTPKALLLLLASIHGLSQTRGPEAIYRELRAEFPNREVTLRWLNLDADAELEAILIEDRPDEWAQVATIYDRQSGAWKGLDQFSCRRNCRPEYFVSVHKLTDDSPKLLFIHQDEGGSDGWLLSHQGYLLHNGNLSPVIRYAQRFDNTFSRTSASQEHLYAKNNALVIHRMEQSAETKAWTNTCSVMTWSKTSKTFEPAPAQQAIFCDAKTGKPIKDKSWLTTLPAWPIQ